MNEWDERFEYCRDSPAHVEGDDLDQIVAWCEPGPGVTAHHFTDPARAIREMARVARHLVVLEDTPYVDELVQRAEELLDATHVPHCTRDEFVAMLDAAGLDVLSEARFPRRHVMDDWLSAPGCAGEAAEVRRLLAHVAERVGSAWTDVKWAAQAVKRAWSCAARLDPPAQMLSRTPST